MNNKEEKRKSFVKAWRKFLKYKETKLHISIVYIDKIWEVNIGKYPFYNIQVFKKRRNAVKYVNNHFKNALVYIHKKDGTMKKRIEI